MRPCVAWAAQVVSARDPEGVLAVLAADHHVADQEAYVVAVRTALGAAESGALVTIGLRPTRAETGYGYLEVGEDLGDGSRRALRFVEKPDRARAEEFVASGRFLWNSGQFFFKASVVLDAIRTHLPALADGLRALAAAGVDEARLAAAFGALPSISIDHGVMEKAAAVRVVPADFGWSDVGSWTTAWELAARDARDNGVTDGDAVLVDSDGCYIRARSGKIVALIGVHDLVVVDTEDALLVVPRDRAQDVKLAVEALARRTPPRGI